VIARGRPPQPGERRECRHPRAAHRHGTRIAYVADRCRCDPCTAANLAAGRSRARAKAFGLWQPYAPAGPVRRHLDRLRAAGIGVDQIARLSGVPGSTVRIIIYGNGRAVERVKTATADRLLTVTPIDASRARRSTVDARTTRSQIHDLLAAGWKLPDLAAELGRNTASLRRTVERATVTVQTASDVARLHNRLLRTRRQQPRVNRPRAPRSPAAQSAPDEVTTADIDRLERDLHGSLHNPVPRSKESTAAFASTIWADEHEQQITLFTRPTSCSTGRTEIDHLGKSSSGTQVGR